VLDLLNAQLAKVTKLDEVRMVDNLGTNVDSKVPFFCTAEAKFRLDSKPDRPYGSPYNSRGYFFSSTYFKYKKKSAEPEFDIYHTAASTSQFAAMIHAAHRTWGPIGFYIVAKATAFARLKTVTMALPLSLSMDRKTQGKPGFNFTSR